MSSNYGLLIEIKKNPKARTLFYSYYKTDKTNFNRLKLKSHSALIFTDISDSVEEIKKSRFFFSRNSIMPYGYAIPIDVCTLNKGLAWIHFTAFFTNTNEILIILHM